MTSYQSSKSSNSRWKSSPNEAFSSERLNEGARPVLSQEIVLTESRVQDFVPRYVQEKFRGQIEPHLCTIKATCKAGDKTPYYTLTLSWYGNDEYNNLNIYPNSKSETSLTNVTLSKKSLRKQRSTQSLVETNVELSTSGSLRETTRRCDGPCQQMRSIKELRVHGRCDHAICSLCIVNAPMVENVDGSMGCCNPECFASDLAALCPNPVLRHKYFQMIINKRKLDELIATYRGPENRTMERLQRAMDSLSSGRMSTTRSSAGSKRGLKEMMNLKLLVLEKGPLETIFRRRIANEIGSTETLRGALQWLLGERRNLEKSHIFFNRGGDYKNSRLQEIDLNRFGNKKIRHFPTINGILSFVVDYTNLIRGGPDSPYM